MFITFEGIDGSGKTTQAKMLAESLEKAGYKVLITREPGGTEFADKIRSIVKDPSIKIDGLTEYLLFASARADHIEKVIKPALKENTIVICDRFIDSSYAYQGYGKNVNLEFINNTNKVIIGDLYPDLTFYIDISPEEAMKRIEYRNETKDRLETNNLGFFMSVVDGYYDLLGKDPREERIIKIDGLKSIDNIGFKIRQIVSRQIHKLQGE